MTTSKKLMNEALKALCQMPAQERVGSERETILVYLMAVEDIPAGFVAAAAKRFIRGQVQGASLTFRPAPPELAVEARRLRDQALDTERLKTLRLPKPESSDPPDPTPEQRQRAAEMWGKAKREIQAAAAELTGTSGKRREWTPPTSEELEASRARIAAHDEARRKERR